LHQAFEAVWRTIKAHRVSETDDEELRAAVSTRLCVIAAEGVTDIETLRSTTLRSFAF
jgi:hypothetical protein